MCSVRNGTNEAYKEDKFINKMTTTNKGSCTAVHTKAMYLKTNKIRIESKFQCLSIFPNR